MIKFILAALSTAWIIDGAMTSDSSSFIQSSIFSAALLICCHIDARGRK